jgi:hypothetical protein
MASLGTFEAAAREYDPGAAERDTFEFYGETFTVYGEIPSMVQMTVVAAMAGKVGGVEGDGAMYEALRIALTVPEREAGGKKIPADDEQWQRFYRLAVAKNAPGEILSAITFNILGAQMGRPTGQRSISSPGPLPISTNSNSSASPSPASLDSNRDAAA